MRWGLLVTLPAMLANLSGALRGQAMSEEASAGEHPAANLSTPGVVITHEHETYDIVTLYAIYAGAGRRVHTVEAGLNVFPEEAPGIGVNRPVDWETTVVPRGARVFGATAGIDAETVGQFWVGWIKDREVYLEALTAHHPVKAPLAAEELVVLPPVMDGSGAASLFSWRTGLNGASLWQTVFKGKTASPHSVAEIPATPVVFRAAAVPGHPERAVVAWAEQSQGASVLGIALVDHGRATVWRSEPVAAMMPLREQRIGIWASNDGRLELSVVLVGGGSAGAHYRIARFDVRKGSAAGMIKSEAVALKHGQLARAAVEYSWWVREPQREVYLLTKDGRVLVGDGLRVVRQSVPLDSPLPIVEGHWISHKGDGSPEFERMGSP
jgi:hypothetical protein